MKSVCPSLPVRFFWTKLCLLLIPFLAFSVPVSCKLVKSPCCKPLTLNSLPRPAQWDLDPKSLVVTRPRVPQKLQFTGFRGMAVGTQDPEKETPDSFLHVINNWAFLTLEQLTDEIPSAQGAESVRLVNPDMLLKKDPASSLPTSCWVSRGAGAHRLPQHCLCRDGGAPASPPQLFWEVPYPASAWLGHWACRL